MGDKNLHIFGGSEIVCLMELQERVSFAQVDVTNM